jgi:predicted metal-dependent phosphoesterase TrpH
MYADLHLHTNFSDGTYTPEELAGHGKRVGLKVMSLTDHDTIDGCARMAAACAELEIEFVSTSKTRASSANWPSIRKCAAIAFTKWLPNSTDLALISPAKM